MTINKWLAFVALFTVSTYFLSCSGKKESKSKTAQESPILVKVNKTSSNSAKNISVSGRVEAVQSANISTRIMGYITKIYVNTGDNIHKDQILFSVSNTDFLAKRSQAEAGVAQAEAAYNSAQKDFDRFATLFKQQSASAKELDNITLQYKSAKAALDAARQMRNEVNAQLSYTEVRAPFSGVVTQKFMDAGNMATPGMPVLTIEQNGMLQVTASVPETQIARVKLGAEVELSVNSAGTTVSGRVSEISSSSQNSGGLYIIKVSLTDNDKKNLLAGMYVSVNIPIKDSIAADKEPKEVLVPESCIIHKGELDGLYTVGSDNQALLRWVRLGRSMNGKVEVLSGLERTELYIEHAEGNLYNGAPIRITE